MATTGATTDLPHKTIRSSHFSRKKAGNLTKMSQRLNMLPQLTFYYLLNCLFVQPILFCQSECSYRFNSIPISNFQHDSIGQFGTSMRFTLERFISALSIPIIAILFMCPNPKMAWIYTRRIITRMTNLHTAWNNNSVYNLPRHAMSVNGSTISVESSVTTSTATSNPMPAFVDTALLHLYPKLSFIHILGMSGVRALGWSYIRSARLLYRSQLRTQ